MTYYNHRYIWIKEFGPIPKDENGRSYEIHHIDGNNKNNNLDNLKLVTIEEHYKIHESQQDWGACMLIAKRMQLPPDHLSKIQLGKKRPDVGFKISKAKKGCIPWNKGINNCFSNETITKMKNTRKGKCYNSKLSKEQVDDIKKDFINHPLIDGVGNIQKNGKILTQERAYSNLYYKKFNLTSSGLYDIIKGKTWKN